MKSIVAITALLFSLSLCSLADRLTRENANESNTESSNSRTANASGANVSSGESVPPPPPPSSKSNGNSAATAAGGAVPGGQLNEKAISLPRPAYPQVAKAARASGAVVVDVVVDETGKVVSANAVSGHPLLRQSAVQAAYQARFRPTMLSGTPVKVSGTITYNFEL